MTIRLRTVIIPAAGKGTRLFPLTKSVPKEMLPVHDRPVLQFALDEAVQAGAERIVIVVHPSKTSIRDYLTREQGVVQHTQREGKSALTVVPDAVGVADGVEVVFVSQEEALGLGHAVLCATPFVLSGPIGVILPDDLIFGRPALVQMAEAYRSGHMIAAMAVPPEDTTKYGIFVPAGPVDGRIVRAKGMVEKPPAGFAPSTLAAVGRYILDPCIMHALPLTPTGRGGEIQLTDAIASDARHLPLTAFRFSGIRHDCGSFEGLLAAGVARMARSKVPAPRPGNADTGIRPSVLPVPEEPTVQVGT